MTFEGHSDTVNGIRYVEWFMCGKFIILYIILGN
jgi:hypothetical protein